MLKASLTNRIVVLFKLYLICVLFLVSISCGSRGALPVDDNDLDNEVDIYSPSSPKSDSLPKRIILGGPVNNYIAEIGKNLIKKKGSDFVSNKNIYTKILFEGTKHFAGNDSTYVTVIVIHPIICIIKYLPPISENVNDGKKRKIVKSYTYGILKDGSFLKRDFSNPGINFTDKCCEVKYESGKFYLVEKNTINIYTEQL
ncbi:hypothetical protein [Sphingobacterium endophyticum]|uniref:hypothetical protein n=1 Tax=Sphingobacterium endophyticum TaxID=2546448 RepID=UPI0012E10631|nr:hypothetical protein [Sphingobacterium endophyticum]